MDARRGTVVLLVALACAGSAGAEEEALVTDRPDQTESTSVVAPGHVQVETGWTSRRAREEGARIEGREAGGSLARVGLLPRVELRVGWDGRVRERADLGRGVEQEVAGSGDTALGAKALLGEERGRRPRIALLAMASLPSGHAELTTDRVDPELRVACSRSLSERLSLGANGGLAWTSEEGADGERDTLADAFYTVSLGAALGQRWGAFAELFGDVPASASGGPAHSFDGGVTFLVWENLQLDLAAGVGLSAEADDTFVGAGLSFRLPR
jgi:hypothetical protein